MLDEELGLPEHRLDLHARLGEPLFDTNGDGVTADAWETFTDTNGNSAYDGRRRSSQRALSDRRTGPAANAASQLPLFFPTARRLWRQHRAVDRISIKDMGLSGNTYIDAQPADRIFRATDDKIFELPADTTQRPILVNSSRLGAAAEPRRLFLDGDGQPGRLVRHVRPRRTPHFVDGAGDRRP